MGNHEKQMQALFVHGMGRSPLSGWPMLRHLQHAGLETATFAYFVALEDFPEIQRRLVKRTVSLAAGDDYVLVGHSLGGVLLRAALNSLPAGTRLPRRLFLLGSPVRHARLAQRLCGNLLYRALTQDCGQLLGSAQRMSEVGAVSVPTTAIVGVRGISWRRGPFGSELNDGVVSVSEVTANWLSEQIQIPVVHACLPSSKRVAEIILERVAEDG